MKTLVIGDPSGSHCARLIEKKNISPEDLVVWEDNSVHKFRIHCVNSRITIVDKLEGLKMKFTHIIANPPYQAGTKSSGNTLWDKFVVQCLELLEDGGLMSFITPPDGGNLKIVCNIFTRIINWFRWRFTLQKMAKKRSMLLHHMTYM